MQLVLAVLNWYFEVTHLSPYCPTHHQCSSRVFIDLFACWKTNNIFLHSPIETCHKLSRLSNFVTNWNVYQTLSPIVTCIKLCHQLLRLSNSVTHCHVNQNLSPIETFCYIHTYAQDYDFEWNNICFVYCIGQ